MCHRLLHSPTSHVHLHTRAGRIPKMYDIKLFLILENFKLFYKFRQFYSILQISTNFAFSGIFLHNSTFDKFRDFYSILQISTFTLYTVYCIHLFYISLNFDICFVYCLLHTSVYYSLNFDTLFFCVLCIQFFYCVLCIQFIYSLKIKFTL